MTEPTPAVAPAPPRDRAASASSRLAGAWLRKAWRPALLLGGLVGAGLALRGLGLEAYIASVGEHGPLAYLLVGSLACAIGVPRQVVAYAGGLAFGFWPGNGLALLAETAGCAVTFLWARLLGRRRAASWLRRHGGGRLDRLDRFLSARTFSATLTLRLLPVGSNMVLNLLAGVSGVRAGPFLAASLLGFVPQTLVFSMLGDGVRVSEAQRYALAVGLFVASAGLGAVLMRRPLDGRHDAAPGPDGRQGAAEG